MVATGWIITWNGWNPLGLQNDLLCIDIVFFWECHHIMLAEMKAAECSNGCEIGEGDGSWGVGRVGESGRWWKWRKKMQWMEEVSGRYRESGWETAEEERVGGGYRYTVFLGETIITMSNGSSHRSLPLPSTVISRTFFFPPWPSCQGIREATFCMPNMSSRSSIHPPKALMGERRSALPGWPLHL